MVSARALRMREPTGLELGVEVHLCPDEDCDYEEELFAIAQFPTSVDTGFSPKKRIEQDGV